MDTVLIVEDDDKARQDIKRMILNSGIDVNAIIECKNGKIALDVLKKQEVDILFTDIHMPNMDGLSLVKEINKLNLSVTMVVVSECDDFDIAIEMMRNNVREYIVKPIDETKFKGLMQKFDREIYENNIREKEISMLYIQQLKYLLINDNICQDEIMVLIKRFKDIFFNNEYVVICLNDYEKILDNKRIIFLKNVDGYDILIAEKTVKYKILKDELKDYYVGVSKSYIGIKNLKKAYLESCSMRKQAFVSLRKVVEAGVNESVLSVSNVDIREDFVLKIVQKIGTEKEKEAIDVILHLIKEVKIGKYNYETFKNYISLFRETIIKTYKSVIDGMGNMIITKNILCNYQNIDDYSIDLIKWIDSINGLILEQFEDYKNKQKVKMAVSFIDENYNKNLNMAVVSNYINMNYSLFSYSFKKYSGMNFVNYLKEKRIKEAKKLLEETELHINEISKKVGYDNEKHFMKTFKNMCGVSPTKYRKNVSLKKN